jgi:hypothetical protein
MQNPETRDPGPGVSHRLSTLNKETPLYNLSPLADTAGDFGPNSRARRPPPAKHKTHGRQITKSKPEEGLAKPVEERQRESKEEAGRSSQTGRQDRSEKEVVPFPDTPQAIQEILPNRRSNKDSLPLSRTGQASPRRHVGAGMRCPRARAKPDNYRRDVRR